MVHVHSLGYECHPPSRPARLSTYTEIVLKVCLRRIPLTALVTVAGLVAAGQAVAAERLELSFDAGRVTVVADQVPLRVVLEEWARLGNTRFVDADKLSGPPVSVQMVDVPERDALRVLLRSATGYVAAPRPAGDAGASAIDRVLIMASGRRPTPRRPPTPPSTGSPPGQGLLAPPAPAGQEDPQGIVARPSGPALTGPADELELIEQLRDRYRPRSTPAGAFGQPSFLPPAQSSPQGETSVQSAPRPGVIVTPEDRQQRPRGPSIPVRPLTPDPSR